MIANRVRRTITEHLEEDPVFYQKLSEMLRETLQEYEQGRYEQLELLQRVEAILERAQSRERFEEAPAVLGSRPLARTYYDIVGDELTKAGPEVSKEAMAEVAVTIDDIIERLRIVNWEGNIDVQNRMRNEIDDALFEFGEGRAIELSYDMIDRIMNTCIEVARRRSARA